MGADEPPERLPWMPPPDEAGAAPKWDQDEADWLLGKHLLVGLTYLAPDNRTVTSKAQYHGRIVSVEQNNGIVVELEGAWAGKTMTLPPALVAFRPANPGEYRLRSTGEIIKDPDVLTAWSITEPYKS